jgi:hypothetical protein
MKNISKLAGIILVISLLVLSTSACMDSATVLMMTVDTPQDGVTVATSPVTVSGTVNKKKAEVKINNVVVPVKDGAFSTDLKLNEGDNVINVVATIGKDTAEKTVKVSYNPSKK